MRYSLHEIDTHHVVAITVAVDRDEALESFSEKTGNGRLWSVCQVRQALRPFFEYRYPAATGSPSKLNIKRNKCGSRQPSRVSPSSRYWSYA